MGGFFWEEVLFDACSEELHDLLLAFARHCAIREHYIQVFPVMVHLRQDIGTESSTQRIQKLSTRRDRISLEVFLILNTNELEQLLHFTHTLATLKSPFP